jgi:hypothetical protein
MSVVLASLSKERAEILCRVGYESVFKDLYFNELIVILIKNWDVFQNWFGRDLADVQKELKMINEFRIDAHAKDIGRDELSYLRVCFKNIEKSLAGSAELAEVKI